ncbi:mechanosensitive ion channel family protein [Tissierella creatinophila]|uniref:Putative MscS family protein YkuT n=1 Tax=Tissierella creatinophila DSM 6911 TaxID=1123403 RepID=A0A1U7M7W4_TISCR|nr:mechanosensitive ion channel family protein [Tissierella creatinophila]OLS03413.1 putative MscS family protein YkuT [Tissierella creatinophila DSM 6911]
MENIKTYLKSMVQKNAAELNVIEKLIKVVIIFVVIYILTKIINKIINKTIKSKKNYNLLINNKRATTLINTLKKTINYFLVFVGVVMALDLFNIDTKSIIATAGIGGLAIGFGAQSLVKDLITGFFILLEDQYSVGELIQTEGYEGIVEDLGVRVTKLRAFSGELHIIPNGNIKIVTNKTRGAMRALVTMSISYEADVNKAIKVLEDVCEKIKNDNDTIIEGPTVLGIVNLGHYNVDINIVAKTNPMDQWAIEREIRKRSKEALEEAGIEIPYPKNVILREKDDNNSNKNI